MALLLRLKTTKPKPYSSPLHHLFSTSNSGDNDGGDGDKRPSFSESLRQVRSSFKQQPTSNTTPSPLSPSKQSESSVDIMSKIQSFRYKTTVPDSDDLLTQKKTISFQDMYSRMHNRSKDSAANIGSDSSKTTIGGGGIGLDVIRGSLNQLKNAPNQTPVTPRWRPNMSPGNSGTSLLPDSMFGKEIRDRLAKVNDSGSFGTVRLYMHDELGEKLKNLRPQVKGKDWFSIAELSERLKKVREMDEIDAKSSKSSADTNQVFNILKDSVQHIKAKEAEKPKASLQRIDMLSLIGGTPSYLSKPPKEHLVEKYFHPDNMSSAEKLKIELTKVRDEFKMSESDCGSARVQVATLTTKIKHLSSVLHKKVSCFFVCHFSDILLRL
ncbi:30S ribosomal protein S15 [Medicago truncatula]|uniref:30S ribosomal protein S15 n=1 Tax=Medicago truncatula TaxID=3880 RepID=A0A072US07_MEDTR|nr:30S ribosomal protein S15 [Medicago truncatula]